MGAARLRPRLLAKLRRAGEALIGFAKMSVRRPSVSARTAEQGNIRRLA